jgi:hypothetical protein
MGTTHYEKIRNSYQVPGNKFQQNDLKMSNMGQGGGLKNMRIGAAPGSHGPAVGAGSIGSKNVRVMLVGNKSSQQNYK